MTKTQLLLGASALLLVGFVLLAAGLPDSQGLWTAGLATVTAAMVLSLATRWARDAGGEDPQPPREER